MKEIKDIFPNEWKEAIELVEQKHTQACENADNGKPFDDNYIEIALIAKVIMENFKITLQNAKYSIEDEKVPLIDTIDLLYNNENELNDHIVMMYYDYGERKRNRILV